MKKYTISKTRCSQCGELISWDEYPDTKHPVHVDENGFKIGEGNCPHFQAPPIQPYNQVPNSSLQYKNKPFRRSKFIPRKRAYKLHPYAIIGIVIAIAIPLGLGLGIGLYQSSNDSPYDPYDPYDPYIPYDPVEPTWEIDAQGIATYIVDGDTYDLSSVGRIRLADIDCPEQGEVGYQEATDYLSSLIYNEHVYIDIDDVYGTDVYGRTVTVTYVRYNSTHLLNVNKDLLVRGYATIWNFDNEFNPYDWVLYVYYP